MSLSRRLALLEWASAADAFVLEDDYDSEYRYAGKPLAALQGLDADGRVVYVGTMSKVMFPGLRLGYMVVPEHLVPAFRAVAKRQLVERDIAVVVAERVTHDEVMRAIRGSLPGELLRSAVLFDVFRPQPQRAGEAMAAGAIAQGEKSLAIRLTLGSDAEALTDAQIDAAVQSVLQALTQQTAARLR